MDTFVCDKLNQWGLIEFKEIFKDEGVDKESLYCLEDQDIDKLITKVGPRARFKKRLKLLKEEENSNTVDEGCPKQNLPSTSYTGKRKLDHQEESSTEKPVVKRQCDGFQFSESVILDDVKKIMAHVLTKLHNEECTDLNEFLMTKIRDLETDKREVVGVFGKTGAGKTSLINAVIGVKKLLPSGDVDACTSVMIKVEGNTHSSKYEAEIEFINKECLTFKFLFCFYILIYLDFIILTLLHVFFVSFSLNISVFIFYFMLILLFSSLFPLCHFVALPNYYKSPIFLSSFTFSLTSGFS